ncbi:MAG: hypothetical protein K2X39_10415 [Silvanigrellaceae bacterium]|nr:hypothetical protein [Silvanigrellaceae bacterium]
MNKKEILTPVSVGELVDKITILKIKVIKITEQTKLNNIQKELDLLLAVCHHNNINLNLPEVNELQKCNQQLWDIEDELREKEHLKQFDEPFIELARKVYITNDRRAAIKKQINIQTGSALVEEKSYKSYS